MTRSLAERRSELQLRAAEQRRALSVALTGWSPPLAAIDRGWSLVMEIRRQPLWLLLPAVVVLGLGMPRLRPWLHRGWMAWGLLRRLAH